MKYILNLQEFNGQFFLLLQAIGYINIAQVE
jgi:hypothetical protein